MVCFNFTPPVTTKLRFTEPTKSRRKSRGYYQHKCSADDCVSQRPALKTNSADFAMDEANSQHSCRGPPVISPAFSPQVFAITTPAA